MLNHDDTFRSRPGRTEPARTTGSTLRPSALRSPQTTSLHALPAEVLVIGRAAQLSVEEEQQLGWNIVREDCPQSRKRLLLANGYLVGAIAGRYVGRGLAPTSLIEQGTEGLLSAVDTFDPAQGARFSTHATWWIKHSIKKALSAAPARSHLRLSAAPSSGHSSLNQL